MFILVSNVQIANACELFKEEDKKHRKFNLMHCWNILKDKPSGWTIGRKLDVPKNQAIRNRRQWQIQVLHQLNLLILMSIVLMLNHL
jgi:hypothetical protein